jgi:cell division protein FtsX
MPTQDPRITVYLKDSVGDVTSLEKEIAAMPGVTKVSYAGKVAAEAGALPTPATIEISLNDKSRGAAIAAELQSRPEVADVSATFPWLPSPTYFLDELEQFVLAPDVSISLKESAAPATALHSELKGRPDVAVVNYLTAEAALAQLKEEIKDHPDEYEMPPNPLPARFDVWLVDYDQSDAFVAWARARPEVEDVGMSGDDYRQNAADTLSMFHLK